MCVLVCSRERVGDAATRLLAELALRGKVLVIDGGNCFQAYPLARALRERTTSLDLLSQRVLIRRAFTAYQMLALLESTPLAALPVVILDLLVTFYDETLPAGQARWLVQRCLQEIERLKGAAPVFLLLRTCLLPQRRFLHEMVYQKADTLFYEQEKPTSFAQPALF
ncbi:MAG: hypothetical protein KatS3mg047_1384 [Bellilinea sp.]|nr:MAG: hypothetical protein KatS3mg047_1384 [Bellilinea sp.]